MVVITKPAVGHYEIEEVQFGTIYRWRAGGVAVCRCGGAPSLGGQEASCALHPWRYAVSRQDAGLLFEEVELGL